jgi:hypothetical protein
MSAQPIHEEPDPQDPQVIHDQLPEPARSQFTAEYQAAVDAAHDPARYPELRQLLRTWAVLAAAYAKPDFHQRYADMKAGVGETVPMDEVFPHRTA